MDSSDRHKRASEEAAEWWLHLQGEVSRTQREQYVDWLRESSLHVAEMLRVAQIHGALEQFERWNRIATDGVSDGDTKVVNLPTANRPTLTNKALDRPKRLRIVRLAAALGTAVVVLIASMLFAFRDQVIQTDRAERREVALADGSVLQVDPDTRLRIKYETRARRVFLDHGRALFHVAKDPNRPFLVEADNTMVRAVGTAFAIERQTDSILVTVSEGRIAVFPDAPLPSAQSNEAVRSIGHAAAPERSGGSEAEIFLTADQQVTVARSGSAEPVHSVDSGRALAWADGRLIFDNSTVRDAIGQFNRYNRIQIYVNDAELARRPISGVFSAADPDSFVAFIQSVAVVRVTRSSNADISIDPVK